MISKRKITAILLFIFMSLFIFTFANPSDGLQPVSGDSQGNDEDNLNNDENNNTGSLLLDTPNQFTNLNNLNNETGATFGEDEEITITEDEQEAEDGLYVVFSATSKNLMQLGNENWSKNNITIKISASNNDKEIKELSYGKTTNSVPNLTQTVTYDSTKEYSVKLRNGMNQSVCVQAEYTDGTKSKIICGDVYNVDKTDPTINGLTPITVPINTASVELNDVTVEDLESGINGSVIIDTKVNKTELDLTTAGTYQVKYKVFDNVGNKTVAYRTVIVEAPAPTVQFTVVGNEDKIFNANGWANENVKIEVLVTDNSNTGIQGTLYCSNAKDKECTPTKDLTSNTVKLNSNSTFNKVCVIATDNVGKTTEVCSNNYNIDKKDPTITVPATAKTIFDINTNIETINNSLLAEVITTDSLSGINTSSLSVDTSNVDVTKAGTYEVEFTVRDNAGNKTTEKLDITIDAPAPTVTFSDKNNVITNGWSTTIPTVINIKVEDNSNTGIKEMYYCKVNSGNKVDENLTCNPTNEFNTTSRDINFEAEVINHAVCVKAIDYAGDETTVCSSDSINFGIDASAPEITIANATETIIQGSVTDYDEMAGVTAKDVKHSGLKSLTYSGEVNPNVVGSYTITYTATDNVGNVKTATKTVIVESNQISYTIKDDASTTNEWNKENVKVWLDELESGATAKYCTSTSTNCTPSTTLVEKEEIELTESSSTSTICIEVSKAQKETKTTCNTYKIDTGLPVITDTKNNQSNIAVMATDTINLLDDITATDAVSGIKSFVITGEGVQLINGVYYLVPSKMGDHTVLYTATDNAGNVQTHQRTYNVDSITPTFTLSTDAKLNGNGWAKADIGVTINTTETDYTKKTCLTTGNSCTPTEDKGLQITNESTSSKMCVTITNKFGKESATVCTDSYKLDKTPPNPGKLVINGTMSNNTVIVPASCPEGYQESTGLDIAKGECRSINATDVNHGEYVYDYTSKNPESTVLEPTGWYISNVVYYATGANDPLSGYSGITYDHKDNTVTEDGNNIRVRAYVTDKAYNSSYLTEYIKRDTVAPTIGEGINTEGSEFYKTQEVLISTFYGDLFDATSGVKELNISGDVVLKDDVYYLDTATTGDKSITLELIDNAGHKTTKTINSSVEEKNLQLNLTSADNTDWTNQDIPVKIEITDEASIGVKSIKYCETSEEKCTPTTLVENTDTVMITEESATSKVCVLVTDNLNREITSCSKEYKIDKTAPESAKIVLTGTMGTQTVEVSTCPSGYQESNGVVETLQGECRSINKVQTDTVFGRPIMGYKYTDKVTSTSTKSTSWYISDVGISVTGATDDLSGYNGFTTNHTNNTVTIDGDNIIVKATITDNVGNTRELTETIKRDTVAPTASLNVEGTLGENGWYTSSDSSLGLFFEPNGNDATSGIASSSITSKSTGVLSLAGKNYIQTAIGGTYDIKVKVTDNAGNTSEETVTLKYDGTAPTVNLGGVIGNLLGTDGWTNQDFTLNNLDTTNLTGDVYDIDSGIQSVTIDPKVVTTEGINQVKVTAKNNAGLTTEDTIEVKIDKTAPTFTGTDDIEILAGTAFDIKEGVTANDNLSGISPVITTVDSNGFIAFVGDINTITNLDINNILSSLSTSVTTIDTTKPGVYTVVYATMDKAGNLAFETRTVKVKVDAPTLSLDFNLKDTTKPLALDNFTLNLGLEDSTDKQLENLKYCMPGQPACQLNLELNSNYIDTLLSGYVPDEYQSLLPGVTNLYGVAEATNENICLTVYTGIAGLNITECVGYNPVADSYNDAVSAIKELEAKINARIQEELTKIKETVDQAIAERNQQIEEFNKEISELRTQVEAERDKLVSAVESTKEEIETEIARIEAEIKRIEDLINSIK